MSWKEPALLKLKSLNSLYSKYIHRTGISNLALMIYPGVVFQNQINFKVEYFEWGKEPACELQLYNKYGYTNEIQKSRLHVAKGLVGSKHINKPRGSSIRLFIINEHLAGDLLSFWTPRTRPGMLLCGELPSVLQGPASLLPSPGDLS